MATGAGIPQIRHVVWDWNGTLFDDQRLVTAATNASLQAVGCALLDEWPCCSPCERQCN